MQDTSKQATLHFKNEDSDADKETISVVGCHVESVSREKGVNYIKNSLEGTNEVLTKSAIRMSNASHEGNQKECHEEAIEESKLGENTLLNKESNRVNEIVDELELYNTQRNKPLHLSSPLRHLVKKYNFDVLDECTLYSSTTMSSERSTALSSSSLSSSLSSTVSSTASSHSYVLSSSSSQQELEEEEEEEEESTLILEEKISKSDLSENDNHSPVSNKTTFTSIYETRVENESNSLKEFQEIEDAEKQEIRRTNTNNNNSFTTNALTNHYTSYTLPSVLMNDMDGELLEIIRLYYARKQERERNGASNNNEAHVVNNNNDDDDDVQITASNRTELVEDVLISQEETEQAELCSTTKMIDLAMLRTSMPTADSKFLHKEKSLRSASKTQNAKSTTTTTKTKALVSSSSSTVTVQFSPELEAELLSRESEPSPHVQLIHRRKREAERSQNECVRTGNIVHATKLSVDLKKPNSNVNYSFHYTGKDNVKKGLKNKYRNNNNNNNNNSNKPNARNVNCGKAKHPRETLRHRHYPVVIGNVRNTHHNNSGNSYEQTRSNVRHAKNNNNINYHEHDNNNNEKGININRDHHLFTENRSNTIHNNISSNNNDINHWNYSNTNTSTTNIRWNEEESEEELEQQQQHQQQHQQQQQQQQRGRVKDRRFVDDFRLPEYSSTSFVRAYFGDIHLNAEPAVLVSGLAAVVNMAIVLFLQHHVLDTHDHLGLFLIGSYLVFATYYMIYYFLERFSSSFRSIASLDKKFYVISNLLKAGIFVSITPFAFYHLIQIIIFDEWENNILRNLGCIYTVPDFISVIIVKRMRWSTWVHHWCVVVFNYFSIMNDYRNENVCRCVVVYAAFSSFAYCVNVLLASRFLGLPTLSSHILSYVALTVYALCCAVNWAWQAYYLHRLMTTGHRHWTVYAYMMLISLVMWDDVVLTKWLYNNARSSAFVMAAQQQRQQQQQQQEEEEQQ